MKLLLGGEGVAALQHAAGLSRERSKLRRMGLSGPSRTVEYDPAEQPARPEPREEPTPEPAREPAPEREAEPVPA